MVAIFEGLSISRSDEHLLEVCAILLLVSHSLQFWSCRVKYIHAGPDNSLQFGTIGELFSGLVFGCGLAIVSVLVVFWVWLPRSGKSTMKN